MIPIRWHRVFLGFAAVSLFLGLVDEICVWLLPPQAMRQVISGLTTGAVVMFLAYRGGDVVRFVLGKQMAGGALGEKVSEALARIHAPETIRFRVVMYEAKNPSAFTISDGSGFCIFVSSAMIAGLSSNALGCVIAHEWGHMLEHHPRKQYIILGLMATCKATMGITVLAILAVILAYLYMLREWEFLADRQAAVLVGADHLVAAFNEFRTLSGEKDIGRISEFLCSHPSLHRRIAALTGLPMVALR